MGLDFDPLEYCRTLKRTPPPYKCPLENCGKHYESIFGLQYHLKSYDHDNPHVTPITTKNRKKGRHRTKSTITPKATIPTSSPKEALTYLEALKVVQFDIDGKSVKVSIEEDNPIVTKEDFEKMVADKECTAFVEMPPSAHIKLPEAAVREIDGYNICDAPPRPNAFIRFIEKSAEELDGEVEYDVDEEDTTWLAIINEKRAEQGVSAVSVDTLELLMDRLEKESYFQAAANGQSGNEVDDDAVCCICMDGECQNTNVILFCDMCNLAVHQDCYGVPYIPEGQWLCRRCLQSPSRPVECVLCPNTGGAFKQTDDNRWAHVVCALWIPEVRFANTVFLEPIDSLEMIPPARWNLKCYICKTKGVGACIQCQKTSCCTPFHVTCAQQAGLHMRMDTVKDNTSSVHPITVQKTAYCDVHCPMTKSSTDLNALDADEKARHKKMKMAREMLAKKRTSVPLILIPTIPPNRLQEISALVNINKKPQFIQRLIPYWTLKRQYRNGVPLLRRLQSQGQSHQGNRGIEGTPNATELYHQLKYWQCLRQDLERARLLCELVRKREKLKVALVRVKEQCIMMEINPIEATMSKLIDALFEKDVDEIFCEPVDINEVPDYADVVKHPMDLSTMKLKLQSGIYLTLTDMEVDFNLMIKNCLDYNNRDTFYYKAGQKMRDQGRPLFRKAREELETEGMLEVQRTDENISKEVDDEYKELVKQKPSLELIGKMQSLLEKAARMKHGLARAKVTKLIRMEMEKIKKELKNMQTDSSQSDMEVTKTDELAPETPPCSPIKSSINSASPAGVNRRTAVLFTRKAAQRKPEANVKEELFADIAGPSDKVKTPKKPGRTKRNSSRKSEEGDIVEKIKSPTNITTNGLPKPKESLKDSFSMPDSFRTYRGQENRDLSDSEEESHVSYSESTCSSCSGFSGDSGSGTDFGSSFEDGPDTCSDSEMHSSEADHPKLQATSEPLQLEPLQLVWAKCRGYPWYPALIIDPQIPNGFVFNGVPLPAPPLDVLALRKDKEERVFLVLFFDAKRTWQWLPPNKLEILGSDKQFDQAKLIESRKPTDRKAVSKAYQDALHYQSQVSDLDGQGPGAIM